MIKRYLKQHRSLLLFVSVAFAVGFFIPALLYVPAQVALEELQDQHDQLQLRYLDALKKLASCEMDNSVVRNSKDALRRSIEEQQQLLAEQDKTLGFYRQLMVADTPKEGLDLNAFSLIPLANHRFVYRFTFVQYARNHATLNLALRIDVNGKMDGVEKLYPLADLLTPGVDLPDRLRFKYFQIVEGTLELPEGYEPTSVIISARANTKNAVPWEREVIWQTQEH